MVCESGFRANADRTGCECKFSDIMYIERLPIYAFYDLLFLPMQPFHHHFQLMFLLKWITLGSQSTLIVTSTLLRLVENSRYSVPPQVNTTVL